MRKYYGASREELLNYPVELYQIMFKKIAYIEKLFNPKEKKEAPEVKGEDVKIYEERARDLGLAEG